MPAHVVQPTEAQKQMSPQLPSYSVTHKSAHAVPCTNLVQWGYGLPVHPGPSVLYSQLRCSSRRHCGLVHAASPANILLYFTVFCAAG